MNPINLRPVDPEWVKLIDDVAERMAQETHSLTVVISLQENGKMGVSLGGRQFATGTECGAAVRMMDEDMGAFFAFMAMACKVSDHYDGQETRQ